MLNTRGCLIRPETAEAKYRLGDAGGTQWDSFFGNRHAKPVGAGLCEPSRAFERAVTVCIGLHDRHDTRRWADPVPDLFEVCGKVIEMNLRPRRASGNPDLLALK